MKACTLAALMLLGCNAEPLVLEPPPDMSTHDGGACSPPGGECETDADCCDLPMRGSCTEPNRCHQSPSGHAVCSFC